MTECDAMPPVPAAKDLVIPSMYHYHDMAGGINTNLILGQDSEAVLVLITDTGAVRDIPLVAWKNVVRNPRCHLVPWT